MAKNDQDKKNRKPKKIISLERRDVIVKQKLQIKMGCNVQKSEIWNIIIFIIICYSLDENSQGLKGIRWRTLFTKFLQRPFTPH